MSPEHKPPVWLHGEIKPPPFSEKVRIQAGYLLRLLQCGIHLPMPDSRPMPSIGQGCHELRIEDKEKNWRIIYRTDPDAIVILDIFEKKTQRTPKNRITVCKERLKRYDNL